MRFYLFYEKGSLGKNGLSQCFRFLFSEKSLHKRQREFHCGTRSYCRYDSSVAAYFFIRQYRSGKGRFKPG